VNLRKTAVIVLLLALVLVIVWGCGQKKKPDTSNAGTVGMPGPGGGSPGAGMTLGVPGRGAAPPGMGMGMPGAGAGPPAAAPSGPAVTVDELVQQGIEDKNAGRLDDAEMKLRAAVLEEANNEDAHWALAWALAQAKKKSEAITEFNKVLALTTDAKRTSEAKAAIQRLQ